jgi:hypothetical protein
LFSFSICLGTTDTMICFYPTGSTKKPEDMYRIIEHFALGKRRLELFGEDHNIRPGWLTLGKGLSYSNFNKEVKPGDHRHEHELPFHDFHRTVLLYIVSAMNFTLAGICQELCGQGWKSMAGRWWAKPSSGGSSPSCDNARD